MAKQKTCTMRELGLGVGDMFAVLTNRYGQPVQFIHRIDRSIYNYVTVEPDGTQLSMPMSQRSHVPDARLVAESSERLSLPDGEARAGILRLMNRCEGHSRKRTWRVGRLRFRQPELAWMAGEGVVLVDVVAFDVAWSKDRQYYVGPGGIGSPSAQPGRYRRFETWLRETGGRTAIEMPEVTINPATGLPDFVNGRHRFAYLRDMGYEILPVSCDVYSQDRLKMAYGRR